MIWIILILLIVAFLILWFAIKWKRLKLDCVSLITGGVKTGKSTLSVHLAIKKYRRNHRVWWFKHFILMRRHLEEPLLYSNIPLTCEYVPVTTEMLQRKERINFKSVMYLCEASLIADSMLFKDDTLNEQLSLFIKLYGHETHGGSLFIDSQAVLDLHYSFKRSISRNLYIYHLTKWIPFILIFRVRELFYSEDNSVVNVSSTDMEDDMKYIVCSKRVWKKFDCYAYSSFTDYLPSNTNLLRDDKKRDLKVNKLATFRKFKTLKLPEEIEKGSEKIYGESNEKREKNKS